MRKKLIFAILGFLIFVIACRNEETFKNREIQKQEFISKSLWKEDMVYIKNVKKVFEVNFNEDKFYQDFGEVAWNYAMTFGNFDESFLRVPIIKDDKVVSTMQVVRNKETDKVFFSHTEDSESINFFQNLLFSKRPLKPLKDSAYPNSNPTGRAYWQSITTCSTRTLYVGCVSSGSTSTDCVPMYKTTTTCTTTYVFVNDYSDDPRGGYNPPDGYNYDGTRPRIVADETKTPCDQTKKLQTNEKVIANNEQLKEKSKGSGEKSYKIKADGTTSDMYESEGYSVNTGDKNGYQGSYHNHPARSIKIFSVPDIINLLTFAIYQGSGKQNDAFVGMIGSTICSSCTGGYKYYNYVIKYTSEYQELNTFVNENGWDLTSLQMEYQRRYDELLKIPEYNDYMLETINEKGLEKLFLETVKNMGLENKISLQKIDSYGKIQNVTLDANNNPITKPCP